MSLLKVTSRETVTGPVLRITCELDYASAGELREQLARTTLRPGQCLVLDLGGMEFCDSSGLGALIVAYNYAQAAQADVALDAVPYTLRVLGAVGLDQIFSVCADGDSNARA
ncbi:STAS domain-containing protein [Streptomyces sp. NPDC047804]|uniref:STAS domain-containing protein n=1 Tax=Streptomyces TaxID=1883 RepID=UPI0033C7C6CC